LPHDINWSIKIILMMFFNWVSFENYALFSDWNIAQQMSFTFYVSTSVSKIFELSRINKHSTCSCHSSFWIILPKFYLNSKLVIVWLWISYYNTQVYNYRFPWMCFDPWLYLIVGPPMNTDVIIWSP